MQFRVWILIASILLSSINALHADTPSTRPQVDPVVKAIQILTKEARDAIRLKQPFPRSESDYFRKSPTRVDVVKLFEALIRPGPNPTIDGYVKWQLISILPDRLSSEYERAGTKTLLFAPPIAPLPGTTSATRDELNQRVEKLKPDEIDAFNQTFESELKDLRERASVIIRYRSEFSSKLPVVKQCLMARLNELWMRGSYGFEIDIEAKIFFKDVREWAPNAKPDQVKQLAATILDYATRPQPVWFDHVEWKADELRAVWITKNIGFDSTLLHNLAIELDPSLANQSN